MYQHLKRIVLLAPLGRVKKIHLSYTVGTVYVYVKMYKCFAIRINIS